jgi:hypothetical protein
MVALNEKKPLPYGVALFSAMRVGCGFENRLKGSNIFFIYKQKIK